jgi:carotenoid cleavage dioxygenase-like enzyme
MADHTRRTVLRGAAVAAAAGLVGSMGGRAAAAEPVSGTAAQGGHRFPFLEGAFKPVTEELTAFDLPVTGRIPRELNGRFLRNGPNVMGLEDPRAHHWMLGEGMVHGVRPRDAAAGEAVFVPSEGARAEDDGYAVAYVHNPDRGAADLVILAAQDFTGEPVARVHLPGRVPLGFHGSWIPDA